MWGILGQDVFEFLICGEVALQFLGEFLGGDLVVGYAYGGGEALEGIAGKDGVFLLADEQADGWLLNGGVEEVVDHVDVSGDLSYIGEVESGGFDFYHTVAVKGYDVEEQVYELFDAWGFKSVFAPEEGESSSEGDEGADDVVAEGVLELGFVVALVELEEFPVVVALYHLSGKVGVGTRKGGLEVVEFFVLSLVDVGGEEVEQEGSSPLVLEAFLDEEECFVWIALDFVDDVDVMRPRYLKQQVEIVNKLPANQAWKSVSNLLTICITFVICCL